MKEEGLNEFNSILCQLKNIEETDEDKAVVLLCTFLEDNLVITLS